MPVSSSLIRSRHSRTSRSSITSIQALRATSCSTATRTTSCAPARVVIIDAFTGRMMPGRRAIGRLHQALEAKERQRSSPRTRRSPRSIPELFRGTRSFRHPRDRNGVDRGPNESSTSIISKCWNFPPTCGTRIDGRRWVDRTRLEKYRSITGSDRTECKTRGQPVLVGTTSIEKPSSWAESCAAGLEQQISPTRTRTRALQRRWTEHNVKFRHPQ